MTLTVVFGGARSGKSDFATSVGSQFSKVVYWATADPLLVDMDSEMLRRVEKHKKTRPSHFKLLETNDIHRVSAACVDSQLLIMDCVTLYLSKLLIDNVEKYSKDQLCFVLEDACSQFCEQLGQLKIPCLLVSNDVGNGVVPQVESGRFFRDMMGFWNQQLAKKSEHVIETRFGIAVLLRSARREPISEISAFELANKIKSSTKDRK